MRKAIYVRLGILALSCTTTLLVTGCAKPTDASSVLTVEHSISPDPPRVGPLAVGLKMIGPDGKPASGAHITLEADMSHPGMAPVFGDATEIAPGQYQAGLKIEMAGDWIVLLHVRLPGGKTLERQFNVNGVRPN